MAAYTITAFQPQHPLSSSSSSQQQHRRTTPTSLNDLSEWRDLFFDDSQKPAVVDDALRQQNLEGPAREVCIFPFPLDDMLIQGETKELNLYEDRFHQLFEKSRSSHSSVVAMGLIAPPSGILQTLPLCEIEDYRKMPGQTQFGTDYSIYVTIRVVGRASLVQVVEEDLLGGAEYLKGWCVEVEDGVEGGEKEGNRVADRLEAVFGEICVMEDIYERTDEVEMDATDEDDDDDESDEEDDYDEDEDDNRRSRFERAYQTAKSTDMQGYTFSSTGLYDRSIQDLTALSWAYFASEEKPEDNLVYRLRALECDDVNERLKLALTMLNEMRSELKSVMKGGVSEEEEE